MKKVTFDSNTKPPNDRAMKICAKNKTDACDNGLEQEVIDLVMKHAKTTREKAIAALLKNDGDIVNAIMYI